MAVAAFVLLRDGDDDGGARLTHAQLVDSANGVCAELARANAELEPPPRPYDLQSADFFAAVNENVAAARASFEQLSPPQADRVALERMIEVYGRLGVRLEAVEAAASVEQEPEVLALFDEIESDTDAIAATEATLGICPVQTTARLSIAAVLRRTRENPLTETGPLIP